MSGFTRRKFVTVSTYVALLAPVASMAMAPFIWGDGHDDEDYVIVDGWILNKSDLKKS